MPCNSNELRTDQTKAGLNLNIFGALAGAFSSKSRKTTQKNKDGSEVSVEDRHDQGTFPCSFLRLPFILPFHTFPIYIANMAEIGLRGKD